MKILVTGASGFVGSSLSDELASKDFSVVRVSRKRHKDCLEVGDIGSNTDWRDCLHGCDIVIHCAARVHIMLDENSNPLDEYRKVNVHASRNLAEQAASAGVKRFIFLSSIKVNGEFTKNRPFGFDDNANFEDAYGQSKYEAEQALTRIAEQASMDVVIIRPPLIYGPGVKGNFCALANLVQKGMPLPLGSVDNKRSLVALENLIDLIITCIDHPAAANQTFLVSDDDDVSTTKLLKRMAKANNKRQILIPIPKFVMAACAGLFGKKAAINRLYGSLQVDVSHTIETLNWNPPVTMQQQLHKIFQSFKD